ncbi:metallophosphoesterase [Herminiimonas sp. CN]|uniref:metallophosphoesterase n=1 Tax=Herminiimonas sp. CN TaxID=1349818 RepID=UPI0004731EDC|nr:metallophosphoesterase [Herminiimonas sp. CN]
MHLAILSDLHLTVAAMPVPQPECDLLILAGDVARPQQAIDWARQWAVPVIYVPGNHEYYGGSLRGTLAALRQQVAGSNVHVLDMDDIRIGGVRFLGCTLWTDFRLFPTEALRAASVDEACRSMRDFSRIKLDDEVDTLFSPAMSQQIFDRSVRWLDAKFAEPFDGVTVVVTHHAPSRGSINPKFADSLLNACFVSDLESQIARWNPALWVHGHTHDSFDYPVANTRVVCNARGYALNGIAENTAFDSALTVSI